MPDSQEKVVEYSLLILEKIHELIEEQGWEEELEESDNATAFIHAFATVAPHRFFEAYTSGKMDHLGFNHIANRLTVQFAKGPKKGQKITF